MRIVVDEKTDKLLSILSGRTKNRKQNSYTINVRDGFSPTKLVKKGHLEQLRNDDGSLQWENDDSGTLKPVKGYVVEAEEQEIGIANYPAFWTIQEVLQLKYGEVIRGLDKITSLYYDEMLDETIESEGAINFGKRICCGKGKIVHAVEKMSSNKIFFDCEYEGEMPKIEISFDGKKGLKITSFPFERDFRKATIEKVYISIDSYDSNIVSYCLGINGNFSNDTDECDYVGRGIVLCFK